MKRRIALLGSTGSIGRQALDVIYNKKDLFEVVVLTANNNYELLIEQSRIFEPDTVVISNEKHYNKVFTSLDPMGIKVYTGESSLEQVVEMESIDLVITAIVGFSGLKPTWNAINSGKAIALANKEILVAAGDIVTQLAKEKNVPLIPIDSEHSAIFQCLIGEYSNPEKIYLTASGGPFRGMKKSDLENVTVFQALHHPKWEMGDKITIDSATMMNKGLEVIEAKWLFSLETHQIEVLVHPQSIVHSMVQFSDGSIKAQLGPQDMRLPIQYALSFPYRLPADFGRLGLGQGEIRNLTFEPPDRETFACLDLAYYALEKGGNMPCILNAANEVAVAAFLQDKLRFLDIPIVIEKCMERATFEAKPDLNSLCLTNNEVRTLAGELCDNLISNH